MNRIVRINILLIVMVTISTIATPVPQRNDDDESVDNDYDEYDVHVLLDDLIKKVNGSLVHEIEIREREVKKLKTKLRDERRSRTDLKKNLQQLSASVDRLNGKFLTSIDFVLFPIEFDK